MYVNVPYTFKLQARNWKNFSHKIIKTMKINILNTFETQIGNKTEGF